MFSRGPQLYPSLDVQLECPPKEHLEAETILKLLVPFPLFNLWMLLRGLKWTCYEILGYCLFSRGKKNKALGYLHISENGMHLIQPYLQLFIFYITTLYPIKRNVFEEVPGACEVMTLVWKPYQSHRSCLLSGF